MLKLTPGWDLLVKTLVCQYHSSCGSQDLVRDHHAHCISNDTPHSLQDIYLGRIVGTYMCR
jgi:hypothetical protein